MHEWNTHNKLYRVSGAISDGKPVHSRHQATTCVHVDAGEGHMVDILIKDCMYIESEKISDNLIGEFHLCDQYPYLDIVCNSTKPRFNFNDTAGHLNGVVVPIKRVGNHGLLEHVVNGEVSLALKTSKTISRTLQELHDEAHLHTDSILKSVGHMKNVTLVGPRSIDPCVTCGIVKIKKTAFERSTTTYKTGELWHCDMQFSSTAALHTGEKMLLIFIDELPQTNCLVTQ